MPKMRSHSGTKKRLTVTATGKVRRGQAGNISCTRKNTKTN